MASGFAQRLTDDLNFGFVDASASSEQLHHPLLISNEHENTMLRAIRHELARAQSFVFSVAFISTSALALLKQALLNFEGRGIIVTSTYLSFNSPDTFRELLDLKNVDVYVHREDGAEFHAKGYVFEHSDSTTAIVGSSNLTANALLRNKEWNLRFSAAPEGDISEQLRAAVDAQLLASSLLSLSWIEEYASRYQPPTQRTSPTIRPTESIFPNRMQVEALEQIAAVRESGERRAVVVSATGTGKTILAALDVRAAAPERMLFVVHREQILDKAIESFARVLGLPESNFGKLAGGSRELDKNYVFASIQSLSRPETLVEIDPMLFDYVLIDEVHRAGAESYKRVIDHLDPDFLLGLTATPERTDGFNIYELFDYNVPYEIRLQAALEADMLAPFHYFGVTDYTDEQGGVVDDTTQLAALVRNTRVEHIVHALQTYGHSGSVRGLMFCSRREEAEALSAQLNTTSVNGSPLRTIALSGTDSIASRELAVEMLECGELDYILTVDIFNEGIDIPSINQVVMLRQTQSSIIFTQQLGRGLRKAFGKDHLRVIDFIGNYANNYLIPIALLGDNSLNKDSLRQGLIESDQAGAIAGLSSINFDEISRQRVLASIQHTKLDSMKNLKDAYLTMKQRLGRVPRLFDFARFNATDPVVLATKSPNYAELLKKFGEPVWSLSEQESAFLTYLSAELLNGKRPHELLLLKELISRGPMSVRGYSELLSHQGCLNDSATIESSLRMLTLGFHTSAERSKYRDQPLIEHTPTGEILLSPLFAECLDSSRHFSDHVMDCLETGLYLARHVHNWSGSLQFGATYSRKDVCRLLNWHSNEYSTIYGYKVDYSSNSCPIFITYHKSNEVAASTRYEDELLDHSTLRWFTRSKRTLQSAEVRAITENQIPLHLFAKKSDAEGVGFHYLGKAASRDAMQEKMPDDTGKLLDVVTMNLKLETPVEESLYSYLTGK